MIDGVAVDFVRSAAELGRPDAVIVPGTKNTLLDLEWLRRTGLADAIVELASSGVPVIGICGGFQMLGNTISDPLGVEGEPGSEAPGLGLLDIATVLAGDKTVKQVEGIVIGGFKALGDSVLGVKYSAYEIHAGQSTPGSLGAPFSRRADGTLDGWESLTLPVFGTYMHGIFDCDQLRRSFMGALASKKGVACPDCESAGFEERISRIAASLRQSLDMEALNRIIGIETRLTEDVCVR